MGKTRVLNQDAPTDAFRLQGAAAGDNTTATWCFGETLAKACTDEQLCNPKASDRDKNDHDGLCVTKDTVVGHGEKKTDTKIVCIGQKKSISHPLLKDGVEIDA